MEALEERFLALYASRSSLSTRRFPLDAEGRIFDYRTEFQRDRDRVIYSRAFRRLRDKSQTHLSQDGDHHRSLLTHALEVNQLGRTVAQALRLNRDLVEAVALGHDLGAPPWGSGGVKALDGILSGSLALDGFAPKTLRELGGFQVPLQSLKVVDLLEKRYDHPGINLTDDCRMGILKQSDPTGALPPGIETDGLEPGSSASAEAQVVRMACRIAGRTQELDDLLRERPELLDRFERLGLLQELRRKLGKHYRSARGHFMRLNVLHRGLTHLLVTDCIQHSEVGLADWTRREKVDSPERYHQRKGALPPDIVGFSERVSSLFRELESQLDSSLAANRSMVRSRLEARKVLEGLFQAYMADPGVLDDYLLLRFRQSEKIRFLRDVPESELEQELAQRYRGSARLVRMICDHLAGMTESYLDTEYRQLCARR